MENAWRGGGEGREGCNMEMISKRDARTSDSVVHGGDEKWTDWRNLEKA